MTTPGPQQDSLGHSDRTLLALAASRLGPQRARRFAPLLGRGELIVLHGLMAGLRFPAAALPPDHPHLRLLLLGHLEVPMQEALRRTVPAGGVVYDIGANIGVFSLLAGRLAGPGGRVLAFEPVPEVAGLIAYAAGRNGLADVVTVRAQAVAGAATTARFHVSSEPSWSHLADRGVAPSTTRTIDVDVTTLDAAVLAGAPPPDVVKIDVEGSEIAVLEGAAAVLSEHRPTILCELHETNAEVCDLLESAGYRVTPLDGSTPVREAGPSRLLATPA